MRITKAQYKGLDAYKYSGMDKSVVSRYILGPFWTWLVTLFPRNLAPNMVSLGLTSFSFFFSYHCYLGLSVKKKLGSKLITIGL